MYRVMAGILLAALLVKCASASDSAEPEIEEPGGEEETQEPLPVLPVGSNQPAAVNPRRPFPQHVAYTPGTIKPDHVSQAELDKAVRDFYDDWKKSYVRRGCDEGQAHVYMGSATGGGEDTITASEGHGYGMIITAYMAGYDPEAKTIFDSLYRYFKAHPSVSDPYLMAWNQVQGCVDVEPGNTGSATDGDMDIAYALLLADQQWGSDGEIDYRAEAIRVIEAILEHEVNTQTRTMLLGDWVTSDQPNYYYSTRSSDFMPGHLRAYYRATGNAVWMEILDGTYGLFETLQGEFSPDAGLLPDFIQETNGDAHPANPGFLEAETDGWYYYNACRIPWRISVDSLLDGDSRGLALLRRLNTWIIASTTGDPAAIKAGYALDGSSTDEHDYVDLAFIAPLGAGAMIDHENQASLNAIWDFTVEMPVQEGGYYDNTLKLLSMLVISGNWWEP